MKKTKVEKLEEELKERKKYPKDEIFFLGQYAYKNRGKLSIEESDLIYNGLRRIESQHPELLLDVAHVYELASDFSRAERLYGTAEKVYGEEMQKHKPNSKEWQTYFDKYKTARIKLKKVRLIQHDEKHEGLLEKIVSAFFPKRKRRKEEVDEKEIEEQARIQEYRGPFKDSPRDYIVIILGIFLLLLSFYFFSPEITGAVINQESTDKSLKYGFTFLTIGIVLIGLFFRKRKNNFR